MIGAVHIEENDVIFSYSQGTDVEKFHNYTVCRQEKNSTYIWIIIKIIGILRVYWNYLGLPWSYTLSFTHIIRFSTPNFPDH